MHKILNRGFLPNIFLFIFSFIQFSLGQNNLDIPNIDFTIIRLNYSDYSFKGYYEFSKPYRKSLPEEFYSKVHNIFYRIVPPSDFGFIDMRSILTGEPIVYISLIWMGISHYVFPADSMFVTDYHVGYESPEPDTLIKMFVTEDAKADTAWEQIKNTDILNRITSAEKYEAVVIQEDFTKEWLIILYSKPVAPLDLAIIAETWPETYLTSNNKTYPEINVHNFSATTLNFKVQCDINQNDQLIYSSQRDVINLQADSSKMVVFEPFYGKGSGDLQFSYKLLDLNNHIWQDLFAYNDTLNKNIQLTVNPVFRPISSIRNPKNIPLKGYACDFDGDNDIDIIQLGTAVKFWENTGGIYYDITNKSNLELPYNIRSAEVLDFNNDKNPDILLIYFDSNPILLSGNGLGIFTDVTDEAGLSNVTVYFDVEAFDIENDNDIDLIFQSYDQEKVFLNDGTGHFTDITQSSGIVDIRQTEGITAADLNNDGFKDLITTNWGSVPKIYINNKNATFSFHTSSFEFIYARMSAVFDFDNDGYNDIVFARNFSDESTLLYRNKGNLTFAEPIELPPSFNINAADINKDGYTDIILDHLENFTLMINNKGKFEDQSYLLVNMENEFLIGALGTSPKAKFLDLDRDGDLDIYSQMVVFENMGLDSTITQINLSDHKNIPAYFKLFQNYPNPFNPITTIKYIIPERSFVTIKVYDILGKQVAELVNGEKPSGIYSIQFNGSNLSSGVYFYRITAGDFMDTKKLIFLK